MRIVSIAILLFLYTFSIAKDKADIAVMGVRATGVSKKMTASITDLISQEVEQMGLYRVVKHKQVQAMLSEVTDNSLLECSAVECLRDL